MNRTSGRIFGRVGDCILYTIGVRLDQLLTKRPTATENMVFIDPSELPNPFYMDENGNKCWSRCPGDRYDVTGVDRGGRRFSLRFDSWRYASSINLWRGSKWLVRGGRRFLITRAYN